MRDGGVRAVYRGWLELVDWRGEFVFGNEKIF